MKIELTGKARIEINLIRCVCGYCGNNDNAHAVIEFNFQENKVIYLCSKCKKENCMEFGKDRPPPYPRMGVSR